jgi:hypothetical protein
MGQVMSRLNLSAREHHRVLACACDTDAGKLACTIAYVEMLLHPHMRVVS